MRPEHTEFTEALGEPHPLWRADYGNVIWQRTTFALSAIGRINARLASTEHQASFEALIYLLPSALKPGRVSRENTERCLAFLNAIGICTTDIYRLENFHL
jgi:hypothetical protein